MSKPKGFLQPLPVEGTFQRVHIDFAGPFPIFRRRKIHLILAVEPVTKYIIARAVPAVTTAQAAHFLVDRIFLVHGWVKEVVDRGTAFTGTLAEQIFELFGVTHVTCTAGHFASNGIAERAIRTFKFFLSFCQRNAEKLGCFGGTSGVDYQYHSK